MSIDPVIHGADGYRDPAIVIGPFKPSYVLLRIPNPGIKADFIPVDQVMGL